MTDRSSTAIEELVRRLQHECARLRHEVQERTELMEDQYGPVAYRMWNGHSLRYDYLDVEDWHTLAPDYKESWEPLYIRYAKQVSV